MKRFIAIAACIALYASAWGFVAYDYYKNDGKLREVLHTTAKKVYDRDGDGKVNCIDYTITFKKEWNKVMPPNHCEIVRNYHDTYFKYTSMNHLFVRVKLSDSGPWLYIEPQASFNGYNYRMEDYWGAKYNPSYNNYGETFYWLAECKR